MSRVTGIVLCASTYDSEFSGDEPATWTPINAWLIERGFGELTFVEGNFGGNKHPQMLVAGGGFNYFPDDEFAEFVIGLPWQDPETVVLVVQPEMGATHVFRPASPT